MRDCRSDRADARRDELQAVEIGISAELASLQWRTHQMGEAELHEPLGVPLDLRRGFALVVFVPDDVV